MLINTSKHEFNPVANLIDSSKNVQIPSVEEIDGIIKTLCQGTPAAQQRAVETYFLPEVSFVHPICLVHAHNPIVLPSLFPGFVGGSSRPWTVFCSRDAVAAIYRWYRFMSPNTVVHIDSKAWDARNQVLYVTARQRFTIWFVPFYKANVRLVVELQLRRQRPAAPSIQTNNESHGRTGGGTARHGPHKYYIARQEDHYQVDDVLRYILPTFGPILAFIIRQFASLVCLLLALPIFLADRTFGDKEQV